MHAILVVGQLRSHVLTTSGARSGLRKTVLSRARSMPLARKLPAIHGVIPNPKSFMQLPSTNVPSAMRWIRWHRRSRRSPLCRCCRKPRRR